MDAEPFHNRSASRFEITTGSAKAFAEYLEQGNVLALTHTYVPPEFRGKGLAGIVVRAALEFARQERKHVDPQCSYAAAYFDRHPEFADLRKAP